MSTEAILGWIPAASSHVAAVWRDSCSVIGTSPAFFHLVRASASTAPKAPWTARRHEPSEALGNPLPQRRRRNRSGREERARSAEQIAGARAEREQALNASA